MLCLNEIAMGEIYRLTASNSYSRILTNVPSPASQQLRVKFSTKPRSITHAMLAAGREEDGGLTATRGVMELFAHSQGE